MKKTDYEHFSRFLMPHSICVKGEDIYFCVKRADMKQNTYLNDLYRLRDKKAVRLTSLGDIGTYRLTQKGIIFHACRTKAEKEAAESGRPVTVFYMLPYDGGESVPFLTLEHRVSDLVILDENRYAFIANEDLLQNALITEDGEKAAQALKDEKDYHVIDEIPFYLNGAGFTNKVRSRLFLLSDGKETALTGEDENCTLLCVKDGRMLIAVTDLSSSKRPIKNRLYDIDVQTHVKKDISFSENCLHQSAMLLSDGRVISFIDKGDRFGLNQNPSVCIFDGCTWNIVYDEGLCSFHNSVGSDIKAEGTCPGIGVPEKNGIYYTLDTVSDHTSLTGIDLYTGEIRRLGPQDMNLTCFDLYKDGFVFIGMGENSGCELYRLSKDGAAERLTDFNTALCAEYSFSKPERLDVVNERGTRIEGWVIKPEGYEAGKSYPAILDIHGGPKTVYGSCYFHEMQLWAARGFFVFFCNPTGGDGRGNEFADIRGDYGGQDYRDIMLFTDKVLDTYPDIDLKRVGVTGGSYGGFMTNWIIGHTDRFAAAASQRSISNWISFCNTSDIGYFFARDQVAGDPWLNPEKMWEQSPLKYADKAITPTLFIHSDEDYRCPLSEGIQMFTALRDHNIEARMCIFKGENHELSRSGKPVHRVRRLREITQWFEKYLQPASQQQ